MARKKEFHSMNKIKVLGLAGVLLASTASVAKADPTQFTGFQVGALLGMSGMHMKSPQISNQYFSNNGGSAGFYLGYGMVLSGFYVGIDGNYTLPFAKMDDIKYKSSADIALRLGMDINKVALPYIRLGYAMNKVNSTNVSGFAYGLGIDTKLAPQMVLGLEAMQTVDSEKNGAKFHFSTVRLKLAFHL